MAQHKKLNINEFRDFDSKNKEYCDGVFKLQLNSWNEFHNVVKILKNNTDYIWRGQNKENTLESSFDRLDSEEKREKELAKIFSNLKQRLKEVRNIDSLESDEVWAIGQHYGLDTPLLDWTESPYIAAYFSFYEKGKDMRVVYALNRGLKLLVDKEKSRFVEFDLNNNNFDITQNKRLKAQKGKFTKSLDGEDIESVVGRFWKTAEKKGKYSNEIILMKILISNKFRDECLQSLKHMGITHGVLFPDNAGAVYICKNDLKK